MERTMTGTFLPTTREDMEQRGWEMCDVILITGDAYIDHPSFGVSVIGRLLEKLGYRVGIIAQPDWRNPADFMKLGKPELFFGISAGNVDSMIANYTANKRPRTADGYSPGNRPALRPDRASIVYANRVRESFKDAVIVLGGIEASMRRLAHYDYWDNKVRRSILLDSRADILVYGMGESQVEEIARRLAEGEPARLLDGIRGTTVVRPGLDNLTNWEEIPPFEETASDTKAFAEAFRVTYAAMEPASGKPIVQRHGNRFVIQFPPAWPLSQQKLDAIYDLPYLRMWHPMYDADSGISGLETVRFSITSHRGCSGECAFCSLYFHQGRIVQSRSEKSILRETKRLAAQACFKGTITDIGGPTANMYKARCRRWESHEFCSHRTCLLPDTCPKFELGYERCIRLYRKMRQVHGVKHVFIGSGLRYDLLVGPGAQAYLREICEHHISGLMKVAPEHNSDEVLKLMNKPPFAVYEQFVDTFKRIAQKLKKKIFIVNYFISAHPGSSLTATLPLALYLARKGIAPEQIQDFTPSPMTSSACMYHTGKDPFTGQEIYVPKTFRERKKQRALIQYSNPANRRLIIEALKELKAMHRLPELTRKRQ